MTATNLDTITLANAVTTTGAQAAQNIMINGGLSVYLTGVLGTGLTFNIEFSHNGTNWFSPAGFSGLTTLSIFSSAAIWAKYVRINITAGTGFTVTAVAILNDNGQ
jgi:hypothetical protein